MDYSDSRSLGDSNHRRWNECERERSSPNVWTGSDFFVVYGVLFKTLADFLLVIFHRNISPSRRCMWTFPTTVIPFLPLFIAFYYWKQQIRHLNTMNTAQSARKLHVKLENFEKYAHILFTHESRKVLFVWIFLCSASCMIFIMDHLDSLAYQCSCHTYIRAGIVGNPIPEERWLLQVDGPFQPRPTGVSLSSPLLREKEENRLPVERNRKISNSNPCLNLMNIF